MTNKTIVFTAASSAETHHHDDEHEKEEDPGKEFNVGGVYCKALGLSGKIMCARPHGGEKRDFTDRNTERVIIEFDSLQERSKGGITVGKAGRKGHMFDAFSKQDFNFTDLSVGSYQGLRMKNFNFSSSLPGPNASFIVMAYMFEEFGNITFGNETSEMRKGMLKFNIQVNTELLVYISHNKYKLTLETQRRSLLDLVEVNKGLPIHIFQSKYPNLSERRYNSVYRR